MKRISILAASLALVCFSNAQSVWKLDKTHTKLAFATTHLLISETNGDFKAYDITITSPKEDFEGAMVDLTIDVNSINTDDKDRDGHLKGADFFDVAKFPTATFKGKSLKKIEGKKYSLAGDLTLHGVTKPITLDVIYNGTKEHPMNKKMVAGFKMTGKINRKDFGVGSYPAAVVGEEIDIMGSFEFFKQ